MKVRTYFGKIKINKLSYVFMMRARDPDDVCTHLDEWPRFNRRKYKIEKICRERLGRWTRKDLNYISGWKVGEGVIQRCQS